jgi:hypothetical protein
MKILKTVMISTMLLFVPAYAFSAELGYMRVSLIEGDVQIKTPDAGEWGLASINGPLAEGDQVWTPQGSRAELQLNNWTYIRLDQDSALQILSMGRDSSQFYLSQGHAYVFYDAPGGSVIQIDTPDASVRSFSRSIFSIDVADQYSSVAVFKGYVNTENRGGSTRINAGQVLSLGQDTNGEVAPLGPADEWEEWNNNRNQEIQARQDGDSRYLPAELRAYSADLNDNGRWVSVPEYGYVWTPTVFVGENWSPYKKGRWIWRGGDYVWVASEPWGWAPYHYGRWAFVASVGWCWVPPIAGDVYWSPGYVGWVRTPNYVAWVPLAPGERYYGRGNYGRNSVNITNVNINQVNVTNVYRNVSINNGVTVVNSNTFNTGSPTIVNVNNNNIIQQNIFVKNNISVGAPDIKPAKGSYFVSTRQVPAAKLPPQPVRNVRIGELKQSRPLIREPDKSVLNRGEKPRTLQVTTVDKPKTPNRERPLLKNNQPAAKAGPGVPGAPGPRGDRNQVQTLEKGKSGTPAGPAPKAERPQFQPKENNQVGVPETHGPRGDRTQVPTLERGKSVAPAGPAPKAERQQFQPGVNKQVGVPETHGPRGDRTQVPTLERGKSVAPAGPAPKAERQQFQPGVNKQSGIQGAPGPRSDKTQTRTLEKVNSGAPGGPGPKGGKTDAKPALKGGQGAQAGPGAKGEKKPGEPFEGEKLKKGQ